MKNTSALHRTRLFINRISMGILLGLAAPLTALAQQTVFYDTFGSSTLNGGPTTNMLPGGTPTASYTSYEIGSGKAATATTNNTGNFLLTTAGTSSGNTEAQALFTKFPVTLAAIGDYVELDYTFTDTVDIYNGLCGNSVGLYCGLYNSGNVPPLSGTLLWNGGFSTSSTTADVGGTKNWLGYNAGMLNGQTGISAWTISTRPVQTAANNTDQQLLFGSTGGSTHSATPTGTAPFPNLTIGSQYTVQFRVTLSAAGTLTVSNAMYAGAGIGGTTVFTNITTYTGANFLTTNFDGLAVGYRDGDSASPHIPWTNDITDITVVAGLAAQAGPYYFLTTSGSGCGSGITVGLSGSVTTNVYLLYTNGSYSGQSQLGTGSAISFGFESAPGIYTITASNTVTASTGPMLGSAGIFLGVPVINSEPTSVTCATNVPALFSIAAIGNALTYQWYKNGAALTNGGDISGAQTPNLAISPTQAADAAATANGYYVVATDTCGNTTTSTPNASLTLVPPNNLVWQGNNPDSTWDLATTLNFTNLSGAFEAFTNGDIVTFNDSSLDSSVNIAATNLIPTLTKVIGTQSYTFSGTGQLTGFGQLVDGSSGTLTIVNVNNYTGGTIISNGATLSLGNGSGIVGSVGGTVTVNTGGTNQYNYAGSGSINGPVNLNEAFAGSGTINYMDQNGSILATPLNAVSSNFNGTINIEGFTCLHASDGNSGYALGNGSTINVPDSTQVWLDRSSTAYNSIFNIGGTGWQGATPNTGAMRVFGNTINGPINLMDDARIGGTITGATLQGVISGPYQLEIWGTTNSFVLAMGPTNGSPQAYASTLITAGSISASGTNAISSGPLTLDSGGDMRLNGYNLTVANLSSIDSGNVLLIEGPRVRNMNATTNATLTVGTDGTSTEFDGTFSDGAAATFGLTKVGAGTLTLTAINTNTGAVTVNGGTLALTGSGSFGKASQIIAGSGAFYDVTGAGGTLTLNSGQALKGGGTVNGILVASAGSTVAPGLPMGTLTVSGNGTINGTYRPNLNRTNSPSNCSQFASSGGAITFSGATLSVTNVGPKLQAGDSFQLFPGATAGFSATQLQTNDVPNNAKYTWNNNVSTSGSITVATVAQIVNTTPTNIVASVSGKSLTLSWPADHTGWTLQTQTNSLTAGLGTNWVNVAGSTTTNQVVMPINPTNGSVFFRMTF